MALTFAHNQQKVTNCDNELQGHRIVKMHLNPYISLTICHRELILHTHIITHWKPKVHLVCGFQILRQIH